MSHGSIVLIVPCYNEASRLKPELFEAALLAQPKLRLLFVDDGSTDGTDAVLAAMSNRSERAEWMQLERNGGKAVAVQRGVLHALEASPTFVGYWDADLATPLEEVPRFTELFDARPKIRAVLGSRVAMLGRRIHRRLSRHMAGRAMASLIALTLGMSVYDSQCGAKIFRVEPELRDVFRAPFESGWVFDVELLARLRDEYLAAGVPLEEAICELPLRNWHDVAGSKVRAIDGVIAMRSLLRLRRRYPPPRMG